MASVSGATASGWRARIDQAVRLKMYETYDEADFQQNAAAPKTYDEAHFQPNPAAPKT